MQKGEVRRTKAPFQQFTGAAILHANSKGRISLGTEIQWLEWSMGKAGLSANLKLAFGFQRNLKSRTTNGERGGCSFKQQLPPVAVARQPQPLQAWSCQ